MKNPEIKPATKIQTQKAIDCAIMESKYKTEISKKLLSLFKTVTLSGQVDQFKILEKKLTLSINNEYGWDYKSLNGIYRKGFEVTYAPNVISWLRQFTALDIDAESRELAFSKGIAGIRFELDQAKENAEPANDSNGNNSETMDDFTNEINSQELDPARLQLIEIAKNQDIPVTVIQSVIRALIEHINHKEVA